MLDNIKLFWDFFFYPLYNIDSMGIISDVLMLGIMVLAIYKLVMLCLGFSGSLSSK